MYSPNIQEQIIERKRKVRNFRFFTHFIIRVRQAADFRTFTNVLALHNRRNHQKLVKSELTHLIKSGDRSAHPRNFTIILPRHDCANIHAKQSSPEKKLAIWSGSNRAIVVRAKMVWWPSRGAKRLETGVRIPPQALFHLDRGPATHRDAFTEKTSCSVPSPALKID